VRFSHDGVSASFARRGGDASPYNCLSLMRNDVESVLMKYLILVITLVFLIFSVSFLHAKDGEFVVTKIIDGDSVVLDNGDVVTYLGIVAPRLKKNEGGPEFFAREAARQNKGLVLMKKVRLEFEGERKDAEGRLRAYVFVKKTFVNGELVRLGCAKVTPHSDNGKYRDLLTDQERRASSKSLGLWQENKAKTDPYYIGNKRTYVFHKPTCPLADKIPEKSRIVFRTRTDPISVGFVPCKVCKP
jgi:micrococcal nuclease